MQLKFKDVTLLKESFTKGYDENYFYFSGSYQSKIGYICQRNNQRRRYGENE